VITITVKVEDHISEDNLNELCGRIQELVNSGYYGKCLRGEIRYDKSEPDPRD
jgi:hypothetical protein